MTNQPISDRIFEEIKKRIVSYSYLPGEVLNEKTLMKEFCVSRTPLREAFIRLEMEQFVVIMPRALTMVSQINFKELKNILEIRIFLESLGARLAAERISDAQLTNMLQTFSQFPSPELTQDELIKMDWKFHRLIYEAMDNPRLSYILNSLYEHFLRFHFSLKTKLSFTIALKDTNELIDALSKRDPDLAEKLMKRHILAYMEKVKDEL